MGAINIPFVMRGQGVLPIHWSIISNDTTANPEKDTCGYVAYTQATKSTVTLEMFRKITGVENNFSNFEIMKVAA